MDKEELKHLKSDCEYFLTGRGEINLYNFVENLRTTYIEPKEKRIEELEEKLAISEHDREHDDYELTEVYKKVEQLEKENARLDCQKNRNKFCYSCVNATEKCFKNEIGCPCDKYKSYKDENAELKCECRRCVYTDSPCILSDYGKDRNGICDHFKDVFDENAELKDTVRNTKAIDESFALQTMQLTKAGKIIKDLLFFLNKFYSEDCPVCMDEARQFLKEPKE